MSVTNSAFLLATIATSIDSAYSMHNACRPCAFCSCTQLTGLICTGKDHGNVCSWHAGWNFHLCSYRLHNVCEVCALQHYSLEHFDDLYQYHSQYIHVGQLVMCMSRKHMACMHWAGTINRRGYSGQLFVTLVDCVHWFETYWSQFFAKFDGFVVLTSLSR